MQYIYRSLHLTCDGAAFDIYRHTSYSFSNYISSNVGNLLKMGNSSPPIMKTFTDPNSTTFSVPYLVVYTKVSLKYIKHKKTQVNKTSACLFIYLFIYLSFMESYTIRPRIVSGRKLLWNNNRARSSLDAHILKVLYVERPVI